MRKITKIALFLMAALATGAANAAEKNPSSGAWSVVMAGGNSSTHKAQRVKYTDARGYAVEREYEDQTTFRQRKMPQWYIGARFDFSLVNFEHKYWFEDDPTDSTTETFSMRRAIGFDANVGYRISPGYALELNYWYAGSIRGEDFNTNAQAITLNGVARLARWNDTTLSAGLGVGLGMVETTFDGAWLVAFSTADAMLSETKTGFAGAGFLSLSQRVGESVSLNLTYKLGYIMAGGKQNMAWHDGDTFVAEPSGILTNTFGIGIQYEF